MSKKLMFLALIAILYCSAESYAGERPKDINMEKCEKTYSKSECTKKKLARDAEQAHWDREHHKR